MALRAMCRRKRAADVQWRARGALSSLDRGVGCVEKSREEGEPRAPRPCRDGLRGSPSIRSIPALPRSTVGRCYPSVEELPEAPDLALIALPGAMTPEAIEACGRRGVRAAIVLAVGFAESGEEGAELQENLLRGGA